MNNLGPYTAQPLIDDEPDGAWEVLYENGLVMIASTSRKEAQTIAALPKLIAACNTMLGTFLTGPEDLSPERKKAVIDLCHIIGRAKNHI